MSQRLGDLLVKEKVITTEQLESIRRRMLVAIGVDTAT